MTSPPIKRSHWTRLVVCLLGSLIAIGLAPASAAANDPSEVAAPASEAAAALPPPPAEEAPAVEAAPVETATPVAAPVEAAPAVVEESAAAAPQPVEAPPAPERAAGAAVDLGATADAVDRATAPTTAPVQETVAAAAEGAERIASDDGVASAIDRLPVEPATVSVSEAVERAVPAPIREPRGALLAEDAPSAGGAAPAPALASPAVDAGAEAFAGPDLTGPTAELRPFALDGGPLATPSANFERAVTSRPSPLGTALASFEGLSPGAPQTAYADSRSRAAGIAGGGLPDRPIPLFSSPGSAAGAGSSFIPLVGLLALLALAVPATFRRLSEAPRPLAPTEFVCALERPG